MAEAPKSIRIEGQLLASPVGTQSAKYLFRNSFSSFIDSCKGNWKLELLVAHNDPDFVRYLAVVALNGLLMELRQSKTFLTAIIYRWL